MISHTSAVAPAAAPITDDNEILVIDSDPAIGGVIVEELIQDGFAAVHGQSAGHARSLARHRRIDAVVLGELTGARSALDLLSEIRCAHDGSCWEPSVPVLLLSDRTGEGDLTRAFARGADDFIARSAHYMELLVRLQAVLRRTGGDQPSRRQLRIGSLAIHPVARTVSVDGQQIELRRREFDLLLHLASEPDRVFTKDGLLRSVWGFQCLGTTRTVDTHACRLRRKLCAGGGHWIANVWGVGYRLN